MVNTHQNEVGELTTPKMGLKTMGRRPKFDIKVDGSVGESFTSLELGFTKDNDFYRCII